MMIVLTMLTIVLTRKLFRWNNDDLNVDNAGDGDDDEETVQVMGDVD